MNAQTVVKLRARANSYDALLDELKKEFMTFTDTEEIADSTQWDIQISERYEFPGDKNKEKWFASAVVTFGSTETDRRERAI